MQHILETEEICGKEFGKRVLSSGWRTKVTLYWGLYAEKQQDISHRQRNREKNCKEIRRDTLLTVPVKVKVRLSVLTIAQALGRQTNVGTCLCHLLAAWL